MLGVVLGVAEADEGVVADQVNVDGVGRVERGLRVLDGLRLVAVVRLLGEANVNGDVCNMGLLRR